MHVSGRSYSSRELARLARFSLTQLEYLSEIELLVPRRGNHGGQHRYDDVNLLRLQQIRIGRARGLALEEIRRWLDAEGCTGSPLLLPARTTAHASRALETEAKVETQADQRAFTSEAERLYVALAARYREGATAPAPALRHWAERHRCHVDRWFCPCDPRQHLAFGRAMARHPLHAPRIGRHGEDLAAFMLRVLAAQREELAE